MKHTFFIFFIVFPFFAFGEVEGTISSYSPPEVEGDGDAVVEKSLSDLDLKSLVDGCSSSDDESFKEINKRCGLGQIDSCRAAASLFERFCNEGIVSSCEKLVDVFERGLLVDGKIVFKKDTRKAVMVAKKACDLDVGLCLTFGSRYLFGFASGYRADPFAGQFLLDKACSSGSPEACNFLGRAYSSGDVLKKNPVLAFKYYFAACKISPESTLWCHMGFSYESGDGVPRNPAYAFKFFNLLCENGDALKCAICGVYYGKGLGVNKDLKQSAAFMDKACALGSVTGCAAIGLYYVVGLGVEKNMFKGAQFYRKGCDMDDARSCLGLGELYFSGNGVPKSSEDGEKLLLKSARLFKVSCSSGNKPDCDHYAKLYDMGYEIKD